MTRFGFSWSRPNIHRVFMEQTQYPEDRLEQTKAFVVEKVILEGPRVEQNPEFHEDLQELQEELLTEKPSELDEQKADELLRDV